ncbi:putative Cystatin domain-containing protein [Lupinus albus]|uniref:Cysteine proteinase inhibitor n=1 Tax=Lupinus albus TaxID=3870 RepID=A0A6A4NL06_LUPAL|nr:putative Cystatin domain-containing protein [Lupinus albus]
MRASLSSSSSSIQSLTLFFFIALILFRESLCYFSEYDHSSMSIPGGITDSEGFQNSLEIEDLARFAVDQHNNKQNALLEFARVVKAQEQVVSGTLHHLTLEAIDADAPLFTSADLGLKKDVHKSGWQSVPTQDPQVQDAADHALKTIQQRSNSLMPYELHEVVDAKAEVIDDFAKFNLLLKVKRGDKEEKFKVEVHKNNEGGFHLNQMEQDHS